MDHDHSFADEPVSITEIKAAKPEATAATWTPRDALIDVLRRWDRGEIKNCDAMVIAYRAGDNPKTPGVHYAISVPDAHVALGLLSRAVYMINEAASGDR